MNLFNARGGYENAANTNRVAGQVQWNIILLLIFTLLPICILSRGPPLFQHPLKRTSLKIILLSTFLIQLAANVYNAYSHDMLLSFPPGWDKVVSHFFFIYPDLLVSYAALVSMNVSFTL